MIKLILSWIILTVKMREEISIVALPYHWTEKDGNDDIDIGAWCLLKPEPGQENSHSEPAFLRFNEFPATCVIELPRVTKNGTYSWNKDDVTILMEAISKKLGDNKPHRWSYKSSGKKLYYYRGEKDKYPLVTLFFSTIKKRDKFAGICNYPISVEGWGNLHFKVYENKIDCVRKLLTNRKLQYTQWFEVKGELVDEDMKISTCKYEYYADWATIKPIPPQETLSWRTKPRMIAFDIETYSDNKRAMPDKYSDKHKAYIISCIYQVVGDKSTRERYGIIIGDHKHFPPGKLLNYTTIQVKNEKEMVDEFAKIIIEKDPEIITGYNILSYDIPYLTHRLERAGFSWPVMGRIPNEKTTIRNITWQSGAYGHQNMNILNMPGRITIDLLPLVKRDFKLPSYNLNSVSHKFLGKGKHDVSAEEMFDTYEKIRNAKKKMLKLTLKIMRAKAAGNKLYVMLLEKEKRAIARAHDAVCMIRDEIQKIIPGSEPFNIEEIKKTGVTTPIDINNDSSINLERISKEYNQLFNDVLNDALSDNQILEAENLYREAINKTVTVLEYAVQDSELTVDLFEVLNVYTTVMVIASIVGVTPMDVFTRGQQLRCLSQLYDLAHTNKIVLDDRQTEPVVYNGGSVTEPIPGLYNNVPVLDFAALYPSIMQAYNICYTTLVHKDFDKMIPDEACNVIEFDAEATNSKPQVTGENVELDIDDDDDDEDIIEEGNANNKTVKMIHHKYKFYKGKPGLLPTLVRNLVASRRATQAQMKDIKDPLQKSILNTRQLGLKVAANSFYGFLGVQNGGKKPLIEGAMSITAWGRKLIAKVADYLKEKYNAKIVYGDTDSVMIDLGITDSKLCDYWGNRLAQEISGIKKSYTDASGKFIENKDADGNVVLEDRPGLFPPPLAMEFEKAMRILCLRKKKYIGLLIGKDGEFKRVPIRNSDGIVVGYTDKLDMLVRGVVLARRDNCKLLQKIYTKLTDIIMRKGSFVEATTFLIDSVNDALSGRVDIDDLFVIKGLGSNYKSDSYYMKVFADNLIKAGIVVSPGDRLEFVIIKDDTKKLLGDKMRLKEQYYMAQKNGEPMPIDYMYYIEKILKNPINQLISVGFKDVIAKIGDKITLKTSARANPIGLDRIMDIMIKMKTLGADLNILKAQIKTHMEVMEKISLIKDPVIIPNFVPKEEKAEKETSLPKIAYSSKAKIMRREIYSFDDIKPPTRISN